MTNSDRPGWPTTRRAVLGGGLALLAAPMWGAQASPVRIERLAPAFDRMIAPGTRVETIATGIRWAEGPLWVPRGGHLLFSDPPANLVRRWDPDGKVRVVLNPSGAPGTDPKLIREPGANGLALARDGALLIANSGGGSIDRVDLATGRREVLVGRYNGKRLNSPNDMHVARDGSIWFTDPPYGLTDGDASPLHEQPHNGIYRWREGRGLDLIDAAITKPNGIALSPDERRLYVGVSDDNAPRIVVYDLDAAGRPLASRTLFDAAPLKRAGGAGSTDGMKVARDGTLVASGPGGILFLSPEGRLLGRIGNGRPMANCAFGQDGRALFIAASDRILRVALRPGWQS